MITQRLFKFFEAVVIGVKALIFDGTLLGLGLHKLVCQNHAKRIVVFGTSTKMDIKIVNRLFNSGADVVHLVRGWRDRENLVAITTAFAHKGKAFAWCDPQSNLYDYLRQFPTFDIFVFVGFSYHHDPMKLISEAAMSCVKHIAVEVTETFPLKKSSDVEPLIAFAPFALARNFENDKNGLNKNDMTWSMPTGGALSQEGLFQKPKSMTWLVSPKGLVALVRQSDYRYARRHLIWKKWRQSSSLYVFDFPTNGFRKNQDHD